MTQTTYFVQAKKNDEVEILAHGKDKETGELWTDFFDKKKARELLEAEKKISPEYQYRIENILQIIKSGEDQKLFKSLYDQIQEARKEV